MRLRNVVRDDRGSRGRRQSRLRSLWREPRYIRRLSIDAFLSTFGIVTAVVVWWVVVTHAQGVDAHAYWAVDAADPYALPYGVRDAFLYSPAAAQVFQFAGMVPFRLFFAIWTAALVGTILWLIPHRWWALAVIASLFELAVGNVHIFIAAIVVLAFTHTSAWWSVAFLLKATPAVGALWYTFRHEWRNLALAGGVTVAVVGVSFALTPHLWSEWIVYNVVRPGASAAPEPLIGARISVPFAVRLPLAVLVVGYAARSDRRWLVPVAVTLALPSLWTVSAHTILYAIPRLRRSSLEPDAVADDHAINGRATPVARQAARVHRWRRDVPAEDGVPPPHSAQRSANGRVDGTRQ